MLQTRSLTKRFRSRNGEQVCALSGIDLTIRSGEFVAITGQSGSGKSTLLLCLGALLEPTSGDVLLDGRELYALPDGQRSSLRGRTLGFVFQSFNLIPYLTCAENVALPALLTGAPRRPTLERARGLLHSLGLGHRLRHRPPELSAGERQRAAICRALINEPAVLLADEPTGNLDGESTREVMDLLLERHAHGQTIVMVTHNQAVAEAAGRILELRKGALAHEWSEEPAAATAMA